MELTPAIVPDSTQAQPQPSSSEPPPTVRRSRMARVRSSISTTLPNLIAEMGGNRSAGPSSRRNSQAFRPSFFESLGGDSDLDADMDVDTPSSSNTTTTESTSRSARTDTPLSSDPSQADMENPTRARPGEDQAAMLSRLLSVAAAMTAASLVGSSEQALTEAQDVAGDSVDGSFESFLRALQNGRLAAALRNGGNEMGGGVPSENQPDGVTAPLNFFRMFRFGASTATATDAEPGETPPSRMVPVIIVGIRSVTPRDSTNTNANNAPSTPPFFDAIANLPPTPPTNAPLTTGANRTASTTRSRLLNSQRRASMGAVGVENSRIQRRASRPNSEILYPPALTTLDTPQGPHPPPSTPADPALSVFPSGSFTPRNTTDAAHQTDASTRAATDTLPPLQRTRRHSTPPVSFSDATGSPSRSSGSRNGTPGGNSGNGSSGSQRRQEGTRSWIIYVLGGSYPENHPILTTPSLFTDVWACFKTFIIET